VPRIPGVATKDASLLIRIGYRFARRRFRVVPEPFTVLARHRRLFMTAARHELAAEKACRTMPKSVLELTYQIGLENMRARMFSSLDIRDQGFSSGDACRLPEAEVTAERG
jgi:hypothetical protein